MADIISSKLVFGFHRGRGGVGEDIAERLGEGIWRNLKNNSLLMLDKMAEAML